MSLIQAKIKIKGISIKETHIRSNNEFVVVVHHVRSRTVVWHGVECNDGTAICQLASFVSTSMSQFAIIAIWGHQPFRSTTSIY